jgi:hypothetical protein
MTAEAIKEQASHDNEIRRIAMSLGLGWPATIEDIINAIKGIALVRDDCFRKALDQMYGRGFRRAFETMKKNPYLWVLFGAGQFEECGQVMRANLENQMGRNSVEGWDSVDDGRGKVQCGN